MSQNDDKQLVLASQDLIKFSSDESISDDTVSSVELSDTPQRPASTKSSLERRALRAERRAARREDRARRRQARAQRRQERLELWKQKRHDRQVLRESVLNARKTERAQRHGADVEGPEISKSYNGTGALGGSNQGLVIKTSSDTVDLK